MERHRPAPVEGLLTVLERAVDLHGHLDIALPGAGIDAARRADIGVIVLVLAERRRERVGVHPRCLAALAPELPRLAILALFEQRIIGFDDARSEEHTSELQSLMRTSYAVLCLKQKK